MFRILMMCFFSLSMLLTACATPSDELAFAGDDQACETSANDEGLDYDGIDDEGNCYGELETSRLACNSTGCATACGGNICVGWRGNASGGCTFSCLVRSYNEPIRF